MTATDPVTAHPTIPARRPWSLHLALAAWMVFAVAGLAIGVGLLMLGGVSAKGPEGPAEVAVVLTVVAMLPAVGVLAVLMHRGRRGARILVVVAGGVPAAAVLVFVLSLTVRPSPDPGSAAGLIVQVGTALVVLAATAMLCQFLPASNRYLAAARGRRAASAKAL